MEKINLPAGNHKIAIMVSGGIDSAILLYRMALDNKKLDFPHQLIPFTIYRQGLKDEYSMPIVQYINQKIRTDKPIPLPLIIGDGTAHHTKIIGEAFRYINKNLKFQHIYTADNTVPPVKLKGTTPMRILSKSNILNQPFFELIKTDVIKQYYLLGVEDMLKITHSCTEVINGRCKTENREILCWQCNERAWAFEKLGVDDPGKT